MNALIVAAGQGSRLRPHTTLLPKPLLEVEGEPLLGRSVRLLKAAGISAITVVVGYRAERIKEHLGDSVSYVTNEGYANTNNMVSMLLGAASLVDEPFLYLHADLWFHAGILDVGMNGSGEIGFVVEKKMCVVEDMKVRVVDDLIVEADKGIPLNKAFGEWTGIIRFEPEGARSFLEEARRMVEESQTLYDCAVVKPLAARGVAVTPISTSGLPWTEIDTADDLEHARRLAAAHSASS